MSWCRVEELQDHTIQAAESRARRFLIRRVRLDLGDLQKFSVRELRRVFFGFLEQPHRALISTYVWQTWLLCQAGLKPFPHSLKSFWEADLKPFYLRHRLGFRTTTRLERAQAILGLPIERDFPSEAKVYAEFLRVVLEFRLNKLLTDFPGAHSQQALRLAERVVWMRMLQGEP